MHWALIALLLLGVSAYYSRDRIIRRAVGDAERSTIEDFPEGASARIVGEAGEELELLIAPATERECIYYELVVDRRRHATASTWETVLEHSDALDFVCDDGTGSALVIVDGAIFDLSTSLDEASGRKKRVDGAIAELLTAHDIPWEDWQIKSVRYRERVLNPGTTLAICGFGLHEPHSDPKRTASYREIATRLTIVGGESEPVYISDDPELL